jgi:CheY-like chemotaxis protein
MSAVLVSADMTAGTKVAIAARAAGVPLAIVQLPEELPARLGDGVRLVILDLSQPGLKAGAAVASVRTGAPRAKIVAFGPHVEEGLLAEAARAGCDLVLTNGQFHRQYATFLAELAGT